MIGVGINVDMQGRTALAIDQAWTDLYSLTDRRDISRNRLAARLLDCLLPALETFESDGMQPFMAEWASARQGQN